MNQATTVFLSVLGGGGVIAIVVLLVLRRRSYQRWFNYPLQQNAVALFSDEQVRVIHPKISNTGWVMPCIPPGAVSGLLEVHVRATAAGKFCDPRIEFIAPGFSDVQCLERGLHGVRFLNITRLLAAGVSPGQTIAFRGHGLAVRPESARLHLFRERLHTSDRVMVIAPHPDDAEIAAFGLYTDTAATIVNITAGDASDRYQSSGQLAMNVPRATVARLRVLDSITIPQCFGVKQDRVVNLCYPDGCLTQMQSQPERDYRNEGTCPLDFEGLRQLSCPKLVREGAECKWESLVRDLEHVLKVTRPTVVVMPHPQLDPHPDHRATTAAMAKALRGVGSQDIRFLLYFIHNRRCELWPLGPARSGTPLLPLFESDGPCGDGFYSHQLSGDRQTEKFLALEAMHDLRDMAWPVAAPNEGAGQRLSAEMRALANGMGRTPLNYFRQAVRPDEVFLTASLENGLALCDRTNGSN